jgi:ligand-binding SRPBCC domain-containing protein
VTLLPPVIGPDTMDALTLTRTTDLDAPAPAVWDAVCTPAAFRAVTRGLLRYPPVARRAVAWREGETVSGRLWLFGVLPLTRHTIRVARIDPARLTLTSDEHGGPIRSWVHDIVLEPLDEHRTRYTDRVRIEAGWATLPVAGFAWLFYRLRQARWRRFAPTLHSQDRDVADN